MKKFFFLFSLVLMTLIGCHKTPDGVDSHHHPVYLSDYSGKWVAVSYWASWCGHCLKELPALNQIYLTHKDKLMVLGVSFDDLTDKQIQVFAKQRHLNFPLLSHFDIQKWGIENVDSIPIVFLFSPDGKLKTTFLGEGSLRQLLNVIDH